MSDHPYFRSAGAVVGFLSRLLSGVRPYLRALIIGSVVIIALPSIAEYWLKRTRIPDVPVSAIVLLLVGSFFLLAFAAAIYAVTTCLLQIQTTERTAGVVRAAKRRQYEETPGSFSTATDEQLWQQEEIAELAKKGIRVDSIDLLKRNGLLTDDDQRAIQEMAEASALKARGRTE